ncbi:MAG: multiheme c-type cytochrome [Phycisphaerales bacterium]
MTRMTSRARRIASIAVAASAVGSLAFVFGGGGAAQVASGPYVAFGYNELGMHCMGDDFAEICILPPYNTLRTQVIRRAEEPQIVSSGVTVSYVVPANTRGADKSNFWKYAPALFGVNLPPDVGLTGHGFTGTMSPTASGHWEVTGIPIVPTDDTGRLDPYPVAEVKVTGPLGSTIARPIVPVSTEMSCSLCHGGDGISVATDILQKHDKLQGTNLESQKPVLCASCHADNALGAPGIPGVSNLSHAMHGAHAEHVAKLNLPNDCYACHPGIRTQCQRDVHLANGIQCVNCHGDMNAVANPVRNPWVDEPRCSDCHSKPGFQFEQPGKLFKDSVGHSGVHCAACHGSPHAITATVTPIDNQQAIALQGHEGVINTCTVCHTQTPDEPFFHKVND